MARIVRIWLAELCLVVSLGLFAGGVVDVRGCCGTEASGDPLRVAAWAGLVVALPAGVVVLRHLFRPRTMDGGAPASHPAYALLLLLAVPVPLAMVWATRHHGDDVFFWRASGYAGLVVAGALLLLRLVAWFVVRRGHGRSGPAASLRSHGKDAWRPVLMLVVPVYVVGGLLLGLQQWSLERRIDGLPPASRSAAPGELVRVAGEVKGDPVYWAVEGAGRGGNNFSGAGVLVDLDNGEEALLLAEQPSVPDFRGVMGAVERGRIEAPGEVVDRITPDQVTFYGFALDDFPVAPAGGRVLVLHRHP